MAIFYIYSEQQKYGINSLKIKQNFFQNNLWTGQFSFIKIHILIPNKIPSSHLFSNDDVIDIFFKWTPNTLNNSIKILLSHIRKFLKKKTVGFKSCKLHNVNLPALHTVRFLIFAKFK
jgi:hypothetical protein